MPVDFDKIQKLNKMAKDLKQAGLVSKHDEAIKMAEKMVVKGEQSIADITKSKSKCFK